MRATPMSFEAAALIADALLLEGYAFHPHRAASIEHRQRWSFGIVAPKSCSARLSEPSRRGVECYFVAPSSGVLHGRLRFLQVTRHRVAQLQGGDFRPVRELTLEGKKHVAWEEGTLIEHDLELSLRTPCSKLFEIAIPAYHHVEWLRRADGNMAGRVERKSLPLLVNVRAHTELVEPSRSLWRLSLEVENGSKAWPTAQRRDALLSSLVSTHFLLHLDSGEFLSASEQRAGLAPPKTADDSVLFPILVGRSGTSETLICSPLALEDNPGIEPRSARLVDRIERLSTEELWRLHGAVRDPARQEEAGS
jgi:hypothetical protein